MQRIAILIGLITAIASTAQAQSFLENMARRAAKGAANRAAAALERGLTGGGRDHDVEERPNAPRAEAPDAPAVMHPRARSASGRSASPAATTDDASVGAQSTGPAPWPTNLDRPRLARPGQLQFDPALEAEKTAFKRFGTVSCSDCEGGESYDTAAKLFLGLRDMWAFDSALGALNLNQSLSWQGRASTGQITVVGETPVGPFPCKQLRWELTRGDQTATRPGLVCLGKSNPDADKDRWMEIF
ncbi:hypothetical protein D3C85_365630 [compost metagenome]